MNTITDKSKFLKLVNDLKILAPLKTYSDTLLFFYIGYLCARNTGDFVEIGVGGSTNTLKELSELCNKTLNIVDPDHERLKEFADTKFFGGAKIETYELTSQQLSTTIVNNLIYSHIDGSKKFNDTISDLRFCLSAMSENGIICQDDYGNHKWPTVTDAVQSLIHAGELKMLIVGDSSAWLTKPEYYDYWINILTYDAEFISLSKLLNITSSSHLNKDPIYFFMNSVFHHKISVANLTDAEIDYFNRLLMYQGKLHNLYLTMPYKKQSTIGFHLRISEVYAITDYWDTIKGVDWPSTPPTTKQDIENMPQWVKDEIIKFHSIDLYSKKQTIKDYITK